MSDARTVRDDRNPTRDATLFFLRYGDYHIIPDTQFIFTPEGLEAAVAAHFGFTREELANEVVQRDEDSGLTITLGQEEADATFAHGTECMRRAFTAAGGVVADEVVEVRGVLRYPGERFIVEDEDGKSLHQRFQLDKRATVYITRHKEE